MLHIQSQIILSGFTCITSLGRVFGLFGGVISTPWSWFPGAAEATSADR